MSAQNTYFSLPVAEIYQRRRNLRLPKIIFIFYVFLIVFWYREKRDTKDTSVSRHMKIKVIYLLFTQLENRERDTTKSYNVRFSLCRVFWMKRWKYEKKNRWQFPESKTKST